MLKICFVFHNISIIFFILLKLNLLLKKQDYLILEKILSLLTKKIIF